MNRPRSVMTTKPVGDEGRAVFDRLFARVFTLPTSIRFRSSDPLPPTLWDGTDPLLGGHQAVPSPRQLAAFHRPERAS